MLDIQYRMHPTISHFPSTEFYNFSLRDGTVDALGNVPSRLLPPSSTLPLLHSGNKPSVIFLDHYGQESLKDRSRINSIEAHIACSLVEDLLLSNDVREHFFAFMSSILIHGATFLYFPSSMIYRTYVDEISASSPLTSHRYLF